MPGLSTKITFQWVSANQDCFVKKLLKIFLFGLGSILALCLFWNFYLVFHYNAKIVTTSSATVKSQAALVLGTSVTKNKKPNKLLKQRLDAAIHLYKASKVKKFLLSGDNSKQFYDEVNPMKNYLIKKKIPGDDIFLDHSGLRTLDSVFRAKQVFEAESIVVISQRFHLSRALYLADAIQLSAIGFAADGAEEIGGFQLRIREFWARILAFVDIHLLNTKPKYFGKPTPLIGTGKITWSQKN